ncbi:MAG: right-handed parallel beta-helix repeat-containing protein [Anaerolineales bacterium]
MHYRRKFLYAMTVVVLISMLATITAYADDTPPPAPTEEPTQLPTEEILPTAEPTSQPVVEAVLDQIPADTAIVVVVDSDVKPLASQAAADAILTGDPVWCPSSVSAPTPGANGCTSSYTSLANLLTYLDGNEPSQDGVIWIEASYQSNLNDPASSNFILDGASFTTMSQHALTIQGGWKGTSGSSKIGSSSVFNGASLVVNNWFADVTIKNIQIQNANGDGLVVATTGNINLSNVDAQNNGGHGASLDNSSGSGTVTVSGKNHFSNNGNMGLKIDSSGNVSINHVVASQNGENGINIFSQGTVTADNLTIIGNGTGSGEGNHEGVFIRNDSGMGNVFIGGTSLFQANDYTGLRISSNGKVIISGVTSTLHVNDFGVDISTYGGNISIVCSAFKNNWMGVAVNTDHSVTEYGVEFTENSGGDNLINGTGTLLQVANYECQNKVNSFKKRKQPLLNIIPVTGDLLCAEYTGTMLLLPNDDRVIFPCPLDGEGSLESVSNTQIPGALSGEWKFQSAFSVSLLKNGEKQTVVSPFITVSFAIPNGVNPQKLAILFWDGQDWTEVENAYPSPDGHFEAIVEITGEYMLVSK